MSKKRKTEEKEKFYASFDEAFDAIENYLNDERWKHDPYAGEVTPDELEPLLRKFWDSAVLVGYSHRQRG